MFASLASRANAREQPSQGDVNPASATPAQSDGTIVAYDRSYFEAFNAFTALDLLRRIPGIQDLLESPNSPGAGQQAQRGFGSTGAPILFNGRRLSGKANDPLDALQRIQVRQVERIEVIRGSVPGYDIRIGNEGTVVNVVLEESLAAGSGSWQAGVEYFSSGRWRTNGKLSYAGDFGPLSYILSAEADPRWTARYTDDTYVLPPDPTPFGRIRLVNQTSDTDYTGTVGLTYAFNNGDVANLNGFFTDGRELTKQLIDSFTILSPVSEIFTGRTLLTRDHAGDVEWEIGGDYEHAFGNGDSMRGLFVVTSDKRPLEINFFSTPPGGQEIQTLRQLEKSDRGEKIVRSFYNWARAPGHSLEVGGELAFNSLHQNNQQFANSSGELVPVDLFNSDSTVKETRLESFTQYSWQILPKLYVEGALDTEYSRLKQWGTDVSTSRSFFFVKPRLDVRYDVGQRTQVRGRILRTVSQLDFSNFVTSVTTNDVRIGVIQAGNPNLVPEKTWTFEVTGEYRLAEDQGVVSLRTFYNDITDAIDKILIIPDVAGAGNIGSAHSFGAELKAGLRLDRLGLTGASIDASGTLQDSSVRDSFTLQQRPLQSFQNYLWSISYRHDTSWRQLSYGATFTGSDARFGSDIDFTQAFKFKPDWEAFAEMPAVGLTFRLEVLKTPRIVTRDRLQYIGNRAGGNLLRQELRFDTFDTTFKFFVKGTF